jgi:transposase
MFSRAMVLSACERCNEASEELRRARARIAELTREVMLFRQQLHEALKLNLLQQADLARYMELVASLQGHRPERVARDELQLAFDHVLESFADTPAANACSDDTSATSDTAATSAKATAGESSSPRDEDDSDAACMSGATLQGDPSRSSSDDARPRKGHGRRKLSLTDLPVREIIMDPPEVLADGGVGWDLIDAEYSERVALPHGGYERVRIVRRTWVRRSDAPTPSVAEQLAGEAASVQIVTAPLPESVWPGIMGDASAIAHSIISKYDDSLPLHRQEHISDRRGFRIPRSTLCNWLEAAYDNTCRIVDAMMIDGVTRSHVIATDATGAPVRAKGSCRNAHIFVFLADQGHIVFRHSAKHTGLAIRTMLDGFHGTLLSDAHGIYEVLYREEGMTDAGCWAHGRRYFYKAIATDRERAMQAIAMIGKLFEIEKLAKGLSPDERQRIRREQSAPIVDLFEAWVDRERPRVEPRSPIDKALGYCTHPRLSLRHFLSDGRVPIHNNGSESELRKVALGRDNWMFFENETGLDWYCVFRSLISSCVMHGLNAETYLEQVLRLAPHWPVTRALELSPKYWKQTLAGLDERYRRIITAPWELDWPIVDGAGLRRVTRAA